MAIQEQSTSYSYVKKNISVVNVNILILHSDSCENDMQEVGFWLMKYSCQNKVGKSFCEFGKFGGCSPLQHSHKLILWASIIGDK